METIKFNESYEAPKAELVETESNGVLCASELNDPADYSSGTDPFGF